MTIYEQIQSAVDHIEANIDLEITCQEVAESANMSIRAFYNYFSAITGFNYGEYLRKRRMSIAMDLLRNTERKIIDIAIDVGYGSHESFSRAFRKECSASPSSFRKYRFNLKGMERINIIKELYVNIVLKELSRMNIVSCVAFAPHPEEKAQNAIGDWARKNGYGELYGEGRMKPHRNFGHDTDKDGRGFHNCGDMDHYGYKVFMTVDEVPGQLDKGLRSEIFEPGRFLVTGVEGDLSKGFGFISDGWRKLAETAKAKGYSVKEEGRNFEEKLEPLEANNLRLDLYLEIL